MMLESLDKRDQGVLGADVTGAQAQESEGAGENQIRQDDRGAQSVVPSVGDKTGVSSGAPAGAGVPAGGGVRVPLIGAGGAGGQEAVSTQAGAGLPTKSMGVVDWAKVIDGYRQSQRAETQQSELSEPSESSEGAVTEPSKGEGTETQSGRTTTDARDPEHPYSGFPEEGTETQGVAPVSEPSEGTDSSGEVAQVGGDSGAEGGGSVSLEPMDAVEVARERKARAVERVVEGLRDETFYNALMRGVEDPREVQRKREAYRRKGAAWRSMVSLADMVANAIDAYGADRNAYTLERGLGTARYDQMLARELSRLDSEYRLAEGLERDALGKVQGREDRARAVELQEARDDLAGAKAERAERARRAREEEEKKYRADRDKVRDDQWAEEFKERQKDRNARRALQARRMNGGGSGGAVRGGRGGSRGGGRSVFFDVWGKNSWNHELLVPEGNEKEFRESAIRYGRSNANWLIKKNPVYVRTYAEQMGLPTGGASTSDLLRMVRKEGKMDDLYAGLAMTSRGFLLSRSVAYGDGEALTRVMEETVSPVRGAVVRGIKFNSGVDLAKKMAKSIVADANACDVSVGEMYQVYESEMYAGVGDNAVGRVDKFMDEVASCFEQ